MDETFLTIRGLINDLVRTLTAAMVHMDDLLLNLNENLDEYGDAWLANEQLGRALKYFFKIRSEILSSKKYELNKSDDICRHFLGDEAIHTLSNIITLVNISCDIVLDGTNELEGNKIVRYLSKSMDHYRQLIDHNMLLISKTRDIKSAKVDMYKNQNKCLEDNKKILLIEDEYEVRTIINKGLQFYGYEVFGCETGEDGLTIFDSKNGEFALSIVDIVLPGIKGNMVGQQLLKINPDIKLLFTSGYDKPKLSDDFIDNVNCLFLNKPFRLQTLLTTVEKLTKGVPVLSVPCPMVT